MHFLFLFIRVLVPIIFNDLINDFVKLVNVFLGENEGPYLLVVRVKSLQLLLQILNSGILYFLDFQVVVFLELFSFGGN